MNSLLALVPISLILLGVAIYAFIWAVRNGQYDDLDTPALDILVDRAPNDAHSTAIDPENESQCDGVRDAV